MGWIGQEPKPMVKPDLVPRALRADGDDAGCNTDAAWR